MKDLDEVIGPLEGLPLYSADKLYSHNSLISGDVSTDLEKHAIS